MLPSLLLSLREGLEAALIIGIVLGALRKMNRNDLKSYMWAGALVALLISAVTAFILYDLGALLEGPAEEIFEGATMLLAASILTWMIFWMQRQARFIKSELEAGVRRATLRGGKQAVFSIAFLAVVREGIELALFLTAATFTSNTQESVTGALAGLVAAGVLGWLVFATTVRLDLRRFFLFTGAALILFAAGLVAQSVHAFNEAGWIPALIDPLWNINPILPESSTGGQLLKSLFGYNGNPSLTEMIAYLGYFAAVAVGLRRNSAETASLQEAV
jgi:high-affinity iron transporter